MGKSAGGPQTYFPPKLKMKAVKALRLLQKKEGEQRRGQVADIARLMEVPRESLANWANSGHYEPDALNEPEDPKPQETLMSRPEPTPVSQPAPSAAPPVTTVQPVQPPPPSAPQYQYPPAPPPVWWSPPQPPPVAPVPAPAPSHPMMGLEEYIKRMVEYEVARQVPIVVQATLKRAWGGGQG